MGVIQGRGDPADDVCRALRRHAGVIVRQRVLRVGAVDVPHADPQLAVLGAAIVHRHDVRVVQPSDGIGLPLETPHKGRVVAQFRAQQFQRVVPRQPRMPDKVDRTHAAGTEFPFDGVAGKDLTRPQRHARHSASTTRPARRTCWSRSARDRPEPDQLRLNGSTVVSQSTSAPGLRDCVQTLPGPWMSITKPSPVLPVWIHPLATLRTFTFIPSS